MGGGRCGVCMHAACVLLQGCVDEGAHSVAVACRVLINATLHERVAHMPVCGFFQCCGEAPVAACWQSVGSLPYGRLHATTKHPTCNVSMHHSSVERVGATSACWLLSVGQLYCINCVSTHLLSSGLSACGFTRSCSEAAFQIPSETAPSLPPA